MLNKWSDYLLTGVSFFLMAQEMNNTNQANNHWKQMYEKEVEQNSYLKEESRLQREEVISQHNNIMELMRQNQQLEEEKSQIFKAYLELLYPIGEEEEEVNEEETE